MSEEQYLSFLFFDQRSAMKMWPKATRNSLVLYRLMMRCKDAEHRKLGKETKTTQCVHNNCNRGKCIVVVISGCGSVPCAACKKQPKQNRQKRLLDYYCTNWVRVERYSWPVLYYYGQSQVKKCTHRKNTKRTSEKKTNKITSWDSLEIDVRLCHTIMLIWLQFDYIHHSLGIQIYFFLSYTNTYTHTNSQNIECPNAKDETWTQFLLFSRTLSL